MPFIEDWIAALRSNEFTQTREDYKQDDCYCAVGVGLYLLQDKNFDYRDAVINKLRDEGMGWVSSHLFLDRVINWNDKDKLTFPQIADKIEEHLNGIRK